MKRLLIFLIVIFILITPASVLAKNTEIMPLGEIRPGMKGYGLTVFKGTKIEKFDVTILGVIDNFIADGEVILFRIDSGYPVDHKIGVIAGMSGSPVYINGRLIGAVAYGWGFTQEPIGGITPIENMLQYLPENTARTTGNKISHSPRPLPEPITVNGRKYSAVKMGQIGDKARPSTDTLVLYPCDSYLQVGGFSDRVFKKMQEELAEHNLICVQAGGSGYSYTNKLPVPDLVPGAAVGLLMVSGDLTMTGTGTVTYRKGDQLLAFGHPFINCGELDFPMTSSYVFGIMPSIYHAFKICGVIRPVGVISNDRLHAIRGIIGKQGNAFPATIRMKDYKHDQNLTYKIKISQNPYFSPMLFGYSILDAFENLSVGSSDNTARIKYNISLPGNRSVQFEDLEAGNDIGGSSLLQSREYLSMLAENQFAPSKFAALNVDVEVTPGKRAYNVERIFTLKPSYAPGESIDLGVLLSKYGGGSEIQNFTIPVPAGVDEDEIQIAVTGGENAYKMAQAMNLETQDIMDFDQLLYYMVEKEKNYQLVVNVVYPRSGLRVRGTNFPLMPTSLVNAFLAGPDSQVGQTQDLLILKKDFDGLIQGSQKLKVSIEKLPGPPEKKEPQKPVTTPEEKISAIDTTRGKLTTYDYKDGVALDDELADFEATALSKIKKSLSKIKELPDRDTLAWSWSKMSDFEPGTFEKIALSSTGELSLAPSADSIFSMNEGIIWKIIPDDTPGGIIASIGSTGKIYRISPEGKVKETYKVPDIAVTALCLDSKGDIIAGTSPHGKVFRIVKNKSEPEEIYNGKCTYVWSILPEEDGGLLIGLGNPARVIRLRNGKFPATVFEPPCLHVTSLAKFSDSEPVIGCASPGTVYQFINGVPVPLITLSGDCDALAVTGNRDIWATSGDNIYRIYPDGKIKRHSLKNGPFTAVVSTPEGIIYAGGGKNGHIFKITPGERIYKLLTTNSAQVTSLAMDKDEILAGSSFPPTILKFGPEPAPSGAYTSQALESDMIAQWGTWSSISQVPPGGDITLDARSGATPVPDKSWTAWCTGVPLKSITDAKLLVTDNRYLQYRLRLKADDKNNSPRLQGLNLYYRYLTQPPLIVLNSPDAGDAWSKQQNIIWEIFSPGGGALAFTIEYSNDGSNTWQPIIKSYSPGCGKNGKYRYLFNTGTLQDGVYTLKIRAGSSDPKKNGDFSGEAISRPFTICNTNPDLSLSILKLSEDGDTINVMAEASSPVVKIKSMSVKLDDLPEQEILPRDLLFDSIKESFTFRLAVNKPGRHTLEFKVADEAGNITKIKRRL